MTAHDPDTSDLLRQTGTGDREARGQLLARHRRRLRKMVAWRLDPRLAPRVDPSDVVQDVLVEADRKLDQFLQDRPLPFYPWLRTLAWDHLAKQYRHHLKARGRSVLREEPGILNLPDESAAELANRLVTSGTSPSQQAVRREVRERVRTAGGAVRARPRSAGPASPGAAFRRRDGGNPCHQTRGGESSPSPRLGTHPQTVQRRWGGG